MGCYLRLWWQGNKDKINVDCDHIYKGYQTIIMAVVERAS